jgi:serine/threonine protein kinase
MVFELCERGCIIDISMDTVAKPLSIKDARNYFRQMILGIEYLHEQSICHRDIKPDNMMISKDDILKIVDFGVSEMFDQNGKLEKEAGSPGIFKEIRSSILSARIVCCKTWRRFVSSGGYLGSRCYFILFDIW